MDRPSKIDEIESLRSRLSELERELHAAHSHAVWTPPQYYAAYEMLGGMVLGLVAAAASLLFNIVGAAMVGKHPLELIRVYLTFPLGESALLLEHGFALAAGVCLYMGTGMFGAIPIHMLLARFARNRPFFARLAFATALGVGVWIINYYCLIAWLQPWLIGGNWILERIPVPVAVITHLIFAWVVALLGPWVQFSPDKAIRPSAANPDQGGGS